MPIKVIIQQLTLKDNTQQIVIKIILPTRSFREDNVIFMHVRISFHKLDTGEVLPMSHGLFEEGLVSSAEVAVDLVWYDAVVPDSFFAIGSCSD